MCASDSKTSIEVLSIFQELNDNGITVLLITHEHDIAYYAKRIIEVRDGMILKDYPVEKRKNAAVDLANFKVETVENL